MSAVIEVQEIANKGNYKVWHDGEIIIESCKDPLTEAARVMVNKGITGRIQMKRRGSDKIDMEGLIAVLATLTVGINKWGTPVFVKYRELASIT
jgi:hypothetical protein